MTSSKTKTTQNEERLKATNVLSDRAKTAIKAIGNSLNDLAIDEGITPQEVFFILGYSFGIEPTKSFPVEKAPENQETRSSNPKRNSSKKRKSSGKGGENQPVPTTVKENKKDSSFSGKRKESLLESQPDSKRQRRDQPKAKSRVIFVDNKGLKEKYSLDSCPVAEGLRSLDGKSVIEPPRGGPVGLMEWILKALAEGKGRTLLQSRGVKELDDALSILRVLCCFIGANSPEDLAYILRSESANRINAIFKAKFDTGCELLISGFKLSQTDVDTLRSYSSFRKGSFSEAWQRARSLHSRVSSEQAKRRLDKEKSKSNSNVGVTSTNDNVDNVNMDLDDDFNEVIVDDKN